MRAYINIKIMYIIKLSPAPTCAKHLKNLFYKIK